MLHGKDMTMRWQRGDGDHGDQAPPHLPLEKEENKNSSSSLIEGVWKTREPIHNRPLFHLLASSGGNHARALTCSKNHWLGLTCLSPTPVRV